MTKQTNRETAKILDRLRKLLALAESENEQEAQRAASMAADLMTRHNISIQDVDKPQFGVEYTVFNQEYVFASKAKWLGPLLFGISKLMDGTLIVQRSRRTGSRANAYTYKFLGTEANGICAAYMADYLIDAAERLSSAAVKAESQKMKALGGKVRRTFRASFLIGFSDRVADRLIARYEERREVGIEPTEAGDTAVAASAIVAIGDAIQQSIAEFLEANDVKPDKKQFKQTIDGGYFVGAAAGDKIGLDQQMAGSARQKMLSASA